VFDTYHTEDPMVSGSQLAQQSRPEVDTIEHRTEPTSPIEARVPVTLLGIRRNHTTETSCRPLDNHAPTWTRDTSEIGRSDRSIGYPHPSDNHASKRRCPRGSTGALGQVDGVELPLVAR
jgi:hypothetical protein